MREFEAARDDLEFGDKRVYAFEAARTQARADCQIGA